MGAGAKPLDPSAGLLTIKSSCSGRYVSAAVSLGALTKHHRVGHTFLRCLRLNLSDVRQWILKLFQCWMICIYRFYFL